MRYLFSILSIAILIQCSEYRSANQTQEQTIAKTRSDKSKSENNITATKPFKNSNCTKKLINAVRKNDSLSIQRLINNGCDINEKLTTGHNYYANDSIYDTALSNSINFKTSKLLLELGANPNIELGERTPLETAIFLRRNDLVKLLINNGADVNYFNQFTEYQSPLITAISTGNIAALKLLIESGAKFKEYGKNIHEPLHQAIRNKRTEVAKLLIKNGISTTTKITPVNLEGDFGDCLPCPYDIEPIHSAVQIKDTQLAIEFIDLLISNNANINAKNKSDQTPLSYIAANGNHEIAQHLISKGASIVEGAIVTSAGYQNNDYLEILLKNGGKPSSSALKEAIFCCGDGFNEASIEKRTKTINLLIQYGAKPTNELMDKLSRQERLKPILEMIKKNMD